MKIRFDDRVAIVTGAGQGLGRSHAISLAKRGAKVIVNDLGASGGESVNAEKVAEEIRKNGGEAIANGANVSNFDEIQNMVSQAMDAWGRVDILVNNAGILRDRTFLKMSTDDMRQVIDVHLMGSMYCTKAVWEIMREQSYGRIVFTTSSTGLYGNFGQTNYGAAKMAMVGMMNTLHLEGIKYDIRVNCLAPAAGTAMTEGLFPEPIFDLLSPESVSPGVVFLSSSDAPSRIVLAAGGGSFAVFKGFETEGINLHPDSLNPEGVAKNWHAISSEEGMNELQTGAEQTEKFARQAVKNLGIKL
ncbi:MAG: 3-oxoacyl-ACP reductase [Gammaproteobacteria bacterium]|nr:3-oxoacyl-ACP reductase [Gammaproteobacteria bacterium]